MRESIEHRPTQLFLDPKDFYVKLNKLLFPYPMYNVHTVPSTMTYRGSVFLSLRTVFEEEEIADHCECCECIL